MAPISSSTSLLSTRSRSFSTGSGGGTSIGTLLGDWGFSLPAFGILASLDKLGTGGGDSVGDVLDGDGNLKFLSIVPLRCRRAAPDKGVRLLDFGDIASCSASCSSGTGAGFGEGAACWLTKLDVSASDAMSSLTGCLRGGGIEARLEGVVDALAGGEDDMPCGAR